MCVCTGTEEGGVVMFLYFLLFSFLRVYFSCGKSEDVFTRAEMRLLKH